MSDRTPIVVGLLAIVAVVAWLLLRGDSAQSPIASPAPIITKQPPPARPSLPSLPAAPPAQGPTAEDTFTAQARETAWAVATEAELAKRWKQIRGARLASTECRQSTCRLIISGPQDGLAQAVTDLEGPRGLHGFAANVLLSSPTIGSDGTVTLRVYAKFDR